MTLTPLGNVPLAPFWDFASAPFRDIPVATSRVSQEQESVQTRVTIQTKQGVGMGSTYKTMVRIAAKAIGIVGLIRIQRIGIEGVAMAKVIEFYVPTSFRKPMKWAPAMACGKVIEFCPQTKKSA